MPFLPPCFIDLAVSHFIQGFQLSWLTVFLEVISIVFTPELLVIAVSVCAVFLLYYNHRTLAVKVACLMIGNVFTPLLKFLFSRPRPDTRAVHVLIHEFGYGFPSGHALGIVLFAAVIILLFMHSQKIIHWGLTAVCILLVLLVGLSRIYLGVHWVTDVAAGYLVAGFWITICLTFGWPRINRALGSA